jgi:hypothetical protein
MPNPDNQTSPRAIFVYDQILATASSILVPESAIHTLTPELGDKLYGAGIAASYGQDPATLREVVEHAASIVDVTHQPRHSEGLSREIAAHHIARVALDEAELDAERPTDQ